MIQKKILLFASIYSILTSLIQIVIFKTFNNYIIKVMAVALLLSLITWLLRDKST